jgi:hypothetical protein
VGDLDGGHLAILVVYYLKDDEDLPLLELHLDRVARHTKVRATIYATANRATPAARALLETAPGVVLIDVPDTDLRGSREHGHYLDQLWRHAFNAGAAHICTLDVDAFPIRDDWVDAVAAHVAPESGLAAVSRLENGDSDLPHPSCTFARRDFYERFTPSFSPDWDGTPEFRRFLHTTGQSADTGIQLGYALWTAGIPWGRLVRTNAVNPHYLMAGIYGDAVFHLGGIGRGKLFREDLQHSTIHRVTRPLERLPVGGGAPARAKRSVLHRARGKKEQELSAQNRAIYTVLRSWLLSDSDGLVAYLRGDSPDPLPSERPGSGPGATSG